MSDEIIRKHHETVLQKLIEIQTAQGIHAHKLDELNKKQDADDVFKPMMVEELRGLKSELQTTKVEFKADVESKFRDLRRELKKDISIVADWKDAIQGYFLRFKSPVFWKRILRTAIIVFMLMYTATVFITRGAKEAADYVIEIIKKVI